MSDILRDIAFLFGDEQHRLGEIVLDAIIRESYELKAEISEHPTEAGDSFVDHVAQSPAVIQIEGVISNTPMTFIGKALVPSLVNFYYGKSNDLASLAFAKLEELFARRTPITIATSLKDYENMVLESLSIERGGGQFESLNFSVTAKQVFVIEQKAIELPKPKPQRAKPKQNLGKQESKPPVKAVMPSGIAALLFG